MVREIRGNEVQHARQLARALNESHRVASAFFALESERNRWRLQLVVPDVDRLGPRTVYQALLGVLTDSDFTLEDVGVVSPKDDIAQAVRNLSPYTNDGDYPELFEANWNGTHYDGFVILWTVRPKTRAELKDEAEQHKSLSERRRQDGRPSGES